MSRLKGLLLLSLGVLLLAGCVQFDPIGPEILYEEDFNSETNWYEGEDELKRWWVENGEYHVLVKTENVSMGSTNSETRILANFQLDVDVRQISGPDDNGYGIQFRYEDSSNCYRFNISGDGYTRFDKWVNGTTEVIRGWESTPLINQGNSLNHITIVANGNLFTFYINGTELYSVADTQFNSGRAGFVAAMYGTPGQTHIAFDNLLIQALE